LAIGTNKGVILVVSLPDPLPTVSPVVLPITSHLHKGGVLGLTFHPEDENLLLTCGMDRLVHLVSVSSESIETLRTFSDHQKFVVRVQWSPSGKFFISSSYDKTVNIYRQDAGETQCYTQIQKLFFKGAVEGVCFFHTCEKFVVGVRDDHRLHIYDLSTSTVKKVETMNMNAIGDDFVSFTAMDVSTSPDDKYILVSTDKDRLILYRSNTGQQVANFYGAISNEYSHPRHCWHPSGQYIYATSQNKAIHVWEVASQKIVTCLEGHSGDVRGLIYCLGMKMLFSCGFDGVVNVWSQAQE
jgi:COMPASS component SWD3